MITERNKEENTEEGLKENDFKLLHFITETGSWNFIGYRINPNTRKAVIGKLHSFAPPPP